MIRKLLAGGSFAAVAAVALLLVTIGGSAAQPAEADVASISTTTMRVGDDFYAQLHIVAEDDDFCNPNCSFDEIDVTASAGDFVHYDPTGFVTGCYDDFFNDCSDDVDSNGFGDDGLDGDCDDDLFGPGDTHITIQTDWCGPDFNTTEIELWWLAPEGFDGGNVTFTAEQDGVTKTATIVVLGSPDTIELVAQRDYGNAGGECAGTPVYVIGAFEYSYNNPVTFDNSTAVICAEVRDNNNSLLPDTEVIWSVTGGGCLDDPVSNNTGSNGLAFNELTSCNTGNSGDTAIVTATSGSASASVQVEFGGDPASCSMVIDPASLDIGDTAQAVATFVDELGNKVPDGIVVNFTEVDSGDGADNVQLISDVDDTTDSTAGVGVIGAIAGDTVIAANIESTALTGDANCSETITLSGDVHQTPGVCDDEDFILYGNQPPANGGFGTFAFCGGTYAQLLEASGCPEATSAFFYNTPEGDFIVWIPGSDVAAVNADFEAEFPQEHTPIPEGTIFTAKCK